MDFRPLETKERNTLLAALRGNAQDNLTILMDRKDTSFVGVSDDEITDDEVISSIKSVPCHY